MPELNFQPDSTIRWFSEPGENGSSPNELLLPWLIDKGLLTARLRRQCGNNFRLEVVADSSSRPATRHHDELRRIVLWCGHNACIYAETVLPQAALAKHPWLGQLGNDPLGESLQTRLDICRGDFEFALLTPAQLPADLPVQTDNNLWARRSEFIVDSMSLLVTEIFLPGVITCSSHQTRAADQN